MKKPKKKKAGKTRNRILFKRYFTLSAIISASLIVLVLGFMVIQYNANNMGLGEPSMKVDVYPSEGGINLNILEREYQYKFSDKTIENRALLKSAVPAPIKVLSFIADIPTKLTEQVLDWYYNKK